MEAKVDVRKLQLLNDRIIQTLEALTQVRASVHGIGQQTPYIPMSQPPYTQPGPWGMQGLGHSPAFPSYYPQPYGAQPYYNPYHSPMGLSHASYSTPYVGQQIAPWSQYAPMQPWSAMPFVTMGTMGLSHTDEVERRMAEQRASDIGRLMQTFPYGAYV